MSSASESNTDDVDAQFFADGARWDIGIVIAVAAVFAGAVFGWHGVAAVLAIPVGLVLIAAGTLALIGVVMWSIVQNIGEEVEEAEDE